MYAEKTSDKRNVKQNQVEPNILFYENIIKSQPYGDRIDNIHKDWKCNYAKLQNHHGFIQWLFPLEGNSGVNSRAFQLKKSEKFKFRQNQKIAERFIKSYEMMLNFYGMKLKDIKTGQITRSTNYKLRYQEAILSHYHNHLRISRILNCLSLVGFKMYAKELSIFLREQIYGQNGSLRQLKSEGVYKNYWQKFSEQQVEEQKDMNILLRKFFNRQLNQSKFNDGGLGSCNDVKNYSGIINYEDIGKYENKISYEKIGNYEGKGIYENRGIDQNRGSFQNNNKKLLLNSLKKPIQTYNNRIGQAITSLPKNYYQPQQKQLTKNGMNKQPSSNAKNNIEIKLTSFKK